MDENKEIQEQETKSFGCFMGRIFGFVLVCCLMAITVATTIKIISWIL